MPFPINTINMILLGYVLTFLAIFLNVNDYSKPGIVFGVIAFVAAYFHERLYAHGTHQTWLAPVLNISAILFVLASYLIWLI